MSRHQQQYLDKQAEIEAARERSERDAAAMAGDDAARVHAAAARRADGEVLVQHSDELLDEIDSILEVNAEEFVKNYVQKPGQ
jgi:ubiquitin-like protein Pup